MATPFQHTQRQALWLALILPASLLGGAYLSQYGFGLYPCEMCWWQRWPHFAALALALAAFVLPANMLGVRKLLVALAGLGILASGLIGAFHAGVEYHWREGITACALPAAGGGNALDVIMAQPIIRCDQAPWRLAGISLAGFNALFSIGGALTIFMLLARGRKA